MSLNDDELRYKKVIDTLKSLQEVKAPRNFEADLMRRINSEKFEDKKQSFLKKILLPSRLIPSAGLAVAAVLLLFVINLESDATEDPLLMEPKVRGDIIEATEMSDIPLPQSDDLSNQRGLGSEKSGRADFRDENEDTGMLGKSDDLSYNTAYYSIDKSGLNFRQVTLSEEEKQRLNELREQFRKLLKNRSNN